jgi:hypothetical protein
VRATDYSHDFENDTVVTNGPTTGTFVQFNGAANGGSGWQVQMGANGTATHTLTSGIDTNGVGGSRALFSAADSTNDASAFFFFWQLQNFNIPAPGAGNTAADVRVQYDMSVAGATNTTPWQAELSQGGGVWKADITPTIATDGSFSHVSFLLSDGVQTGVFDPTQGLTMQLSTGSGGYGFDAGNAVHLDNVSVTVVPEPSLLGLLAVGGMLSVRRRA